jgi:hypothetical protein
VDDGEEDQVGGVEDDVDGDEEAKNETRSFTREDQLDAVLIEVVLPCIVVVRPCDPRPLHSGPSAPVGAPAADIVAPEWGTSSTRPRSRGAEPVARDVALGRSSVKTAYSDVTVRLEKKGERAKCLHPRRDARSTNKILTASADYSSVGRSMSIMRSSQGVPNVGGVS